MIWVISKTSCDGIGNVMKGFISALSVNPNTKIECNPDYRLGGYDSVLDEEHIYSGGPCEHFYTCRLLVLREEEDEQENILNEFQYTNGCGNPNINHHYSLTKLIDWNYDASRLSVRVRERILRAIDGIRFQERILRSVESYVSQFRQGKTLGISVRTWKASHEQNIDRPYDFQVYANTIRQFLPSVSTVVLSVDNESVVPEYMDLLQNKHVIVLYPQDTENETQRAFIKMLTLARCDLFIGNRISTFTELVFWFSRCKSQVTTVF
jgi:hypothetical protein